MLSRVLPRLVLRRLSASSGRLLSSSPVLQAASEGETEWREDVLFTEEHRKLQDTIRKVIDTEINPYVDEWEAAKSFPAHRVFKKLGEAGILGIDKDPAYNGLGLDFSFAMAGAEALGHIRCGGIPMAIGVQADMATPALANFGSDEMKRTFLAPSVAGDLVACLGVSEAGAGSDVASVKTTARKSGDDYVVNGGKMWTTNGLQADWMCLLANTEHGAAHASKSLICLPLRQDDGQLRQGISISRAIEKLGMHSSDTAQYHFEDVRVPVKNVIGEPGMGFTYQMIQFQTERLWAAAICLEQMETLISETIAYTRDRKAFGRPILDNQVVHFRLAEMATEVELCRSTLYRATVQKLRGEDVTRLASMLKLKIGRLSREVCDGCLQYWGGMGFTAENLVARFYRDNRLLSIGGGADEVMLAIICKYMGTLPKK